jgi:hypothetical protein
MNAVAPRHLEGELVVGSSLGRVVLDEGHGRVIATTSAPERAAASERRPRW